MLTFFRRIRNELLVRGATRKYLFYAIGEILLVMIGILLALQVSNWNQERKNRIEEFGILKNLHQESLMNKDQLIRILNDANRSYSAGMELMKLMGEQQNIIEQYNVDSLIFYSIENPKYTPSENVISDLLQSGRLQLLRNDKLRDLLFQWSSAMLNHAEQFEDVDKHASNFLIPYLTDNYALRDIDMYGQLNWDSPSKLAINKMNIFQDIKYENLQDDQLYKQVNYRKVLKQIELILSLIIEETRF